MIYPIYLQVLDPESDQGHPYSMKGARIYKLDLFSMVNKTDESKSMVVYE